MTSAHGLNHTGFHLGLMPVCHCCPCRQLAAQLLAAVQQSLQQETVQQLGRPAMALCPCCLVVVVVVEGIQLVVLRLVLGGVAV
jgi:hypothetical protein